MKTLCLIIFECFYFGQLSFSVVKPLTQQGSEEQENFFSTARLERSQIPLGETRKTEPLGLAVQSRSGLEGYRQKWGGLGLKYRKSPGISLRVGLLAQQEKPKKRGFAQNLGARRDKGKNKRAWQVRSWIMVEHSLISPFFDLSHELAYNLATPARLFAPQELGLCLTFYSLWHLAQCLAH